LGWRTHRPSRKHAAVARIDAVGAVTSTTAAGTAAHAMSVKSAAGGGGGSNAALGSAHGHATHGHGAHSGESVGALRRLLRLFKSNRPPAAPAAAAEPAAGRVPGPGPRAQTLPEFAPGVHTVGVAEAVPQFAGDFSALPARVRDAILAQEDRQQQLQQQQQGAGAGPELESGAGAGAKGLGKEEVLRALLLETKALVATVEDSKTRVAVLEGAVAAVAAASPAAGDDAPVGPTDTSTAAAAALRRARSEANQLGTIAVSREERLRLLRDKYDVDRLVMRFTAAAEEALLTADSGSPPAAGASSGEATPLRGLLALAPQAAVLSSELQSLLAEADAKRMELQTALERVAAKQRQVVAFTVAFDAQRSATDGMLDMLATAIDVYESKAATADATFAAAVSAQGAKVDAAAAAARDALRSQKRVLEGVERQVYATAALVETMADHVIQEANNDDDGNDDDGNDDDVNNSGSDPCNSSDTDNSARPRA